MVHKAIIEHQYQQFNSFENIHFSQILFILKAKNLKHDINFHYLQTECKYL